MSAGFQCKKFYIAHDQCAMKVSTDGLMLGAWAPLPEPGSAILDIGAGSGLISLMLAQRSAAASPIDAIELDDAAVLQAAHNVQCSPWPEAVQLIKGDILTYQTDKRYRLIVSNPPFFHQALPAQDARRHQARHTDSLPFTALLEKAARLLADNGQFCLILPSVSLAYFQQLAQAQGWQLVQHCRVKTTAAKAVSRELLCYQRSDAANAAAPPAVTELLIQHHGRYSADYQALLKPFYLNF